VSGPGEGDGPLRHGGDDDPLAFALEIAVVGDRLGGGIGSAEDGNRSEDDGEDSSVHRARMTVASKRVKP
jgi:hypothetical protein